MLVLSDCSQNTLWLWPLTRLNFDNQDSSYLRDYDLCDSYLNDEDYKTKNYMYNGPY